MRSLRISAVVALLSIVPTHAIASPLLELTWSSSELEFGLNTSSQHGEYSLQMYLDGWDIDEGFFTNSFFLANTGPLTQLSLHRDVNGNLLSSDYFYTGGTFWFDLYIDPYDESYPPVSGTFTAPILSARHNVWGENNPHDSGVESYYSIGAGVFDKRLARALGIKRHTGPGIMDTTNLGHITFFPEDGNYTSIDRYAHDGGLYLRIPAELPEPALGLITLIGLAAARLSKAIKK
jgi:hypothetical protein